MSRVGSSAITIPADVTLSNDGGVVVVKVGATDVTAMAGHRHRHRRCLSNVEPGMLVS